MEKVMGWKAWMFSVALLATTGSQAAEINLNSATDFIHIDMLLKEEGDRLQTGYEMNVMLSPEAAERMTQLTRASIGQQLTVSVNGRVLSTATVQSELGARFRMVIPKAVAKDLLPTLVD
jgi:preprotein translocase subunit SecD